MEPSGTKRTRREVISEVGEDATVLPAKIPCTTGDLEL